VIAVQELGQRGEYVILETPGTNALDFHIAYYLDFHIAYYLGILTKDDPKGFFHIISKDTGFDSLIKHLKSKKIFSVRSSSIEEMPCFAEREQSALVTQCVDTEPQDIKIKKPNNYIDDLVQTAVNDLIKRKASKPRTPKTLLSTIHAKCGKDLPNAQIETVFKKMQQLGYVKIKDTRVSYTLPDE
jgi:hypothetical protein